MTTNRTATVADVARSVLTSDAAGQLAPRDVNTTVQLALRTVIGLNCMNGNTLDIDLGNGHFLHCSLKRAIDASKVIEALKAMLDRAKRDREVQHER